MRRTIILFCLGLFLNLQGPSPAASWRIPGVLQRFAISYFFCSLLLIYAPHYNMYVTHIRIYISMMMCCVHDAVTNSPDAPTAFTNIRLHLAEWYYHHDHYRRYSPIVSVSLS